MEGYSGTGNRKGRQHARTSFTHRATPRLYTPLDRPFASLAGFVYGKG